MTTAENVLSGIQEKFPATLLKAQQPQTDRLYLTVLSRYPTDDELKTVAAYFQKAQGNKWPAAVDLTWALINSAEFLYRH